MIDQPILIAGFGSIGRRHFRNLKALGYKKFIFYRTGKGTLPDNEIADFPQESNLKKVLAYKPLATIVANPTALHLPVALEAARAGSHLFIEKPISHTTRGVEELRRLVRHRGLIVQVGFQFRFHPSLRRVKRQLEEGLIGPVVSAQAHWGEYLPDWHPWEDYRQSYCARAELGGGVLLTLCHPFDYLRWLFGVAVSVTGVQSKNGGLEIKVEDSADILLNFKSGVIGNVHLDYWQQPAEHFIRIIGQNGIIRWDNPKSFDRNKMFLAEMRHFLACIKKKEQPLCTLEDGIESLRIVLAAKKSVEEKRLIRI